LVELEPRLENLQAEIAMSRGRHTKIDEPSWYFRAGQFSRRRQHLPAKLESVRASDVLLTSPRGACDPNDRQASYKYRMMGLVGYCAEHPDPRVRSSTAYDLAYRRLYAVWEQAGKSWPQRRRQSVVAARAGVLSK
jgi:hypothetical protein